MAIIVSTAIERISFRHVNGVDGMSFFLEGIQSAFGPLAAALLADEKWSQRNIGYVLSLGGPAGLLGKLPGGELLHAPSSERFLIAPGGTVVAVSALVIAHWPNRPVGFVALILQGLTGGLSVQLSQRSAKIQSVVTSFRSTARRHRRSTLGVLTALTVADPTKPLADSSWPRGFVGMLAGVIRLDIPQPRKILAVRLGPSALPVSG